MIITTGKVFFKPDIKTDEEVAAPHLLDLELSLSGTTVPPSYRDHDPAETANNGFQRDLNRYIEVMSYEWPTAINYFPAVRLEGVGGVIEFDPEKQLEKLVGKPVDKKLDPGIIDSPAALDEAATKNAIISFVEFLPVTHNIPAVVRFIGHHNDYRIAAHVVQSADDSPPEAVRADVLHRLQLWQAALQFLDHLPGMIGAAVVHIDDFVRNSM